MVIHKRIFKFIVTPILFIIALWFILWFLVVLMWMSASFNAYNRCSVRGYTNSEVIVDYPKFWKSSTLCYKADSLENGTKL
jgi:hypothetical protein